jgi:hypothetical protein
MDSRDFIPDDAIVGASLLAIASVATLTIASKLAPTGGQSDLGLHKAPRIICGLGCVFRDALHTRRAHYGADEQQRQAEKDAI